MSIFDKFMRSIGFASNDDDLGANSLNKKSKHKKQKKLVTNQRGFLEFSPSSQEEIFDISELLKKGAKMRLDLSGFEEEDLYRAVDFLQGVCFALDISPKFFDDNIVELNQ